MSGVDAFWVGMAVGGPSFLGLILLGLWLGDLYNNRKGKRRDARWAALALEAEELKAHNTADLSNLLMQVGIEFHDQMAKVLISEGWTK